MEFLFELLVEGLTDAAGHPKVPVLIRLIIITVVAGGAATIIFLAGFSGLKATGLAGAIFCWVTGAGLGFIWLYLCYKIIKTRKSNKK